MANDSYIDRISHLPIDVIGKILSFLSTKDAFRTSFLSKEWKYKCAVALSEFDIDEEGLLPKKTAFVNIVNYILDHSTNIKRFHLSYSDREHELSELTRWIYTLFRRSSNVESFEISVSSSSVVLPRNLLNYSSLRTMVLNLPCIFRVVNHTNCFPNLTTLYLENVRSYEGSDTRQIKFSFPFLERFAHIKCEWLNVGKVEIYAPKLVVFNYRNADKYYRNGYGYLVDVHVEGLAKFKSYRLPEDFVVIGARAIYAALDNVISTNDHDQFLQKICFQVRRILRGFSGKALQISKFLAKVISEGTEVLFELHPRTQLLGLGDLERIRKDCDYLRAGSEPLCIISQIEEDKILKHCYGNSQLHLVKFLLRNAICVNRLGPSGPVMDSSRKLNQQKLQFV